MGAHYLELYRLKEGGSAVSDMQVNSQTAGSAAFASSRQAQAAAQTKAKTSSSPSLDLCEMMKDAREKAEAAREKFKGLGTGNTRYGDAPIEAYARLARAKRPAEVNAAAGYARRQIVRLRAAKRTDPDNARRIQAAINQLQKAVSRAGKKNRELNREKVERARQAKLAQEKKTREAQRQRLELRRKQTMRMLRESGYIREAEVDNRMQSHISAVEMELREQARNLASSIQPSLEAVAQQYAAGSAEAAAPPDGSAAGGLDVQA